MDSLYEILKLYKKRLKISEEIINSAKILDFYYIPARYPNGFSQGKPYEYFTKEKGLEAKNAADRIIQFCESILFQ